MCTIFDAYTKIFARCELDNSPVQADSGAMGGSASAESSWLNQKLVKMK